MISEAFFMNVAFSKVILLESVLEAEREIWVCLRRFDLWLDCGDQR